MPDLTCADCRHFRQHYVKLKKAYHISGFGHCVYPRIKARKAAAPACEKFSLRESDT